jgi:hypothetical protein
MHEPPLECLRQRDADHIIGQHAPNIITGALVATSIASFFCSKLTLHHRSRRARNLPKPVPSSCYSPQLHLTEALSARPRLLSYRVLPEPSRLKTSNLRDLSPRANYTDLAIVACKRSWCQLLRIEGCRLDSAADLQGRNLGFLDWSG